jgi:hypothetical protein
LFLMPRQPLRPSDSRDFGWGILPRALRPWAPCQQRWSQQSSITPTGKPPPLAVRLAKALPFRRAQVWRKGAISTHDHLPTADGDHIHACVGVVSSETARQGRRYGTQAAAPGGLQGLQALSPRRWPPLGAFIKLPALRVVHDWLQVLGATELAQIDQRVGQQLHAIVPLLDTFKAEQ